MPSYNKGPYISTAIASVLSQTLEDLELVVVDDGSTDSSSTSVERLAAEDSRIRLVRHANRLGPSAARNTGIRRARGGFVCLLDSDDIFSPTWVEHAVQRLVHEGGEGVAYADWWLMDVMGRRTGRKRPRTRASGMIFGEFLRRSLEVNSVLAAPRSCFLGAGLYDESLVWGEDYDFVLRLAQKFPFYYVDEEAYGYRLHPGNSWRGFSRKELYRHKARVLGRHLGSGRLWLTEHETAEVEERLANYYVRSGQRWGLVKLAFGSKIARPLLKASLTLSPIRASRSVSLAEPGALNTLRTASEK
jgi:glycosyltransferase involved in cell wall biosynthesis